ncbi:hypothetical protein [Halorubellus sp. PRR65]|uniref:hypothetical protein n=1 Tax=Halorubellus sp. PRR65 TaxID=3098148 RepID=UPI002B258F8F|nr:hypothetical protein [Halorubellus sp. PRR65]
MSPSRRALLSAATAATTSVVLAGCSGTGTSGSSTRSSTESVSRALDDPPPYAYLRADADLAAVWRPRGDQSKREARKYPGPQILDSQSRADELEYADVDGADAVRAFVADTDFDAETVYVDQRTVPACYRLELCGASWTSTDVDLEYSRLGLAYDVPCEADAEVVEARFLRLPDALDHETVSSMGSRTGSGGCPGEHAPVAGSEIPGHDDAGTATEGNSS